MTKKSIIIFWLTLLWAFFIGGCAQTSLAVHEKLDRKSLRYIKSTDVFLITIQNGLVAHFTPDTTASNSAVSTAAQFAPANGAGLIGLILGGLLTQHIETSQQKHQVDKKLQEVKDAMQGYSLEKRFSEKLNTNLHKLKWLNSSNTNIVNATSDKSMLNSVLDESNSPTVLTIAITYSLDKNFNAYWINAEVTLYPKSKQLLSHAEGSSNINSDSDENQESHPILYRNYFHYVKVLKEAMSMHNAADTWSNSAGPYYIRDVTETGLETLARLITYDLSLYPYHLKDKYAKTQVSALDGSSTIHGTLIAENKSMISLRTKFGYIYCLPRTK